MRPSPDADHLLLWAKTVSGDPWRYHPLGYHSLDVAAVADILIESDGRRFASIAEQIGLTTPALRRLTVWLVAMHDIGKASRVFQHKATIARSDEDKVRLDAILDSARPQVGGWPHGQLTHWYLTDGPVAELFERLTPGWYHGFRTFVIDAVAGHHGRPVRVTAIPDVSLIVGGGVINVAADLAREMAEVIGAEPTPIGEAVRGPAIVAYAWYVATLLPLADWIASNTAWFDATSPRYDLADYWTGSARPKAPKAVLESGIGAGRPSQPDAAIVLPPGRRASPVQAWAETVAIPANGPMLAIVEDATGSGKTEAALILAHRLMHSRLATGFYLALPTMATANAMFVRLGAVYARLFEPGSDPSLILAHGKAQRNPEFMVSVGRRPLGNGGEEDVARYCNGWIADDRRKAFFAQSGAGTIDQAALAVLPSKYQTLRLRGLADKVLILDEIHAYDAYLSAEVEGLLRFHAAQGGSAILLSATLPSKTRSRLLDAFAEGARWQRHPAAVSTAYPLATTLTEAGIIEAALGTRPENDRVIRVERVATVDEAEALALVFAARGAAVALIRSTVDAAIDSFQRLSATATDGADVDLFHARFLPSDRDAIERRVMRRFGKDGGSADRRGRILVATQVIEQSLDIDFDAIVTDLAPVDLLIQRAGRLWRHRFRDQNRPLPEAVLYVISPPPPVEHADGSWLDKDLIEAKWVYRDPSLLWQSAAQLFDAGRIVIGPLSASDASPAHVRRLVETVYRANRYEVLPTDLHKAALAAEGDSYAAQNLVDQILLRPNKAYGIGDYAWSDDTIVQTRLDDGSRPVRLAMEEAGKLVPLGLDPNGVRDWVLSELRLRPKFSRTLTAPTPEQAGRLTLRWAEADMGVRLLVMVRDGEGWVSTGEPALRYTARTGLARATPK